MKKSTVLLPVILILAFLPFVGAYANNSVTADTINGQAIYQGVNLAVQIVAIQPTLVITSPRNVTYATNSSIYLDYTSSNSFSVWYNLDKGTNITVTNWTMLNVTTGSHTIYVYANNSDGLIISKSVTFTTDTTRPVVFYPSFYSSPESTNLNSYGFEELQNLSGLTLDNPSYGQIRFNDAINVTNAPTNSTSIDLNSYIKISALKAEVNSTVLSSFNKNATITMRGVSLTDPELMLDGSPCPDTVCTIQSYSDDTLVFNVSHFSTYTVQERTAPGSNTVIIQGGGGGGGGSAQPAKISLSDSILISSLKQGETKTSYITVTNVYTSQITVQIGVDGLANMILMVDKNLTLQQGQSVTIPVSFLASQDTLPDRYAGVIKFTENGNLLDEIHVILDVSTKNALLDTTITIPSEFKQIIPGHDVIAKIDLFNLGKNGSVDVNLDYEIIDSSNRIILTSSETTAVETSKSLIKTFTLPADLPAGEYVFYVRSEYAGQIASASDIFSVGAASPINSNLILLIIGIIIAIIIVSQLIGNRIHNISKPIKSAVKMLSETRNEQPVHEQREKMPLSKVYVSPANRSKFDHLVKQLRQLDYSHTKGFVEEEEYRRVRENIIKRIRELSGN